MGADLRAGLRYLASVRVLVILTAVQMGTVTAVAAAAGWLAGLRKAGPGGCGARR